MIIPYLIAAIFLLSYIIKLTDDFLQYIFAKYKNRFMNIRKYVRLSELSLMEMEYVKPENIELQKFYNPKDFQGVWDAPRIIDTLCTLGIYSNPYAKPFISYSVYKIIRQRLESVFKSYGKSIRSGYMGAYSIMSKSQSKENLEEIKNLLNSLSPSCEQYSILEMIGTDIDRADGYEVGPLEKATLFIALLNLYREYLHMGDTFAGVIECSKKRYGILKYVQDISLAHNEIVKSQLQRLLVLLLGDDYKIPVTEIELIENYDYPIISNDQLWQLEKDC